MTKRIGLHVQTLGAVALVLIAAGCGSSNNPSVTGTAGTTGNTTGTAGTTGAGTAGTTGAGTAGTTGTGTAGTTGATGTAGTTGTGGGGGFGQPACASSVVKGGTCTTTDVQLCYKTCGPEKTGVKSEMCTTSATYAEMAGCSFDQTLSYACYKIPTAANAACPLDADAGTGAFATPQGSQPCTTDHCVICNSAGGLAGGNYADSTGASKPGYCTCQVANASGNRVWTCASDTAWPCPANSGC